MKTIALMSVLVLAQVASGQDYVRGYYRPSGTYVSPHYRSLADGNFYNNWSTYGNYNPYTGAAGTRLYPPANSYRPTYSSPSYYSPSYYPPQQGGINVRYGW